MSRDFQWIVSMSIGAVLLFTSSIGWAQNFRSDCPDPFVPRADFSTYSPGTLLRSPLTNNDHIFETPAGDWLIEEEGIDNTEWLSEPYDSTTITFPTDSNGDPDNGGIAWVFYVHEATPYMQDEVYNADGDPISYDRTEVPDPNNDRRFNVYYQADEPIAKVEYNSIDNELGVHRACAW